MMMNKKVINCAVIGCGGFSRYRHLPSYKALKRASLVAICDLSAKKARQAKKDYGAQWWTTDFKNILKSDDIQMIDIATSNDSHAHLTVAALKAGKHVLVQKPMATTIADAKRMLECSQKSKVKLCVYMEMRSWLEIQETKRIIEKGCLGKIIGIHSRAAQRGGLELPKNAWRRSLQATGGGSFIQLSIHHLDILRLILGETVRVTALSKTLVCDIEGDDITSSILEFENGSIATIESSYCAYQTRGISNNFIVFYGTEGNLLLDFENGNLSLSCHRRYIGDGIRYNTPSKLKRWALPLKCKRPILSIHQQFIDAILDAGPSPVPAIEGLKDLEIVKAIYESSRRGRTITL